MRYRIGALALLAVLTSTLACGVADPGSTNTSAAWVITPPVEFNQSVASAPLLASSPIADFSERTVALNIQSLAADTPLPAVSDQLRAAGFLGGRERTFQGWSKDLTLVRSRALVFADAQGAQRYLDFLTANPEGMFGTSTTVAPIHSQNHSGSVFQPPPCACHRANPVVTGVVRDGSTLVWLSINGPLATTARLTSLLRAPTTTR